MTVTPGVVLDNVAVIFVPRIQPSFVIETLTLLHSLGSIMPLPFPPPEARSHFNP